MKIKSIEEKAKAYDKVREKIALRFGSNVAKEIFSEYEESEDERIRKEIIAIIHLYYGEPLEDEAKEMIAWLENLCEHKKFRDAIQVGDKVTRNEDGVLVNLSQLKRVAKPADKQGEQKPQRIVSAEAKEAMYDKPAWSEEDELKRSTLVDVVKKQQGSAIFEGLLPDELVDWLKSLKDRVQLQPKQEWNEEDETALGDALWCCEQAASIAKDENDMGNVWYAEHWLKSLRPQSQWKPSDEQMEALKGVQEGVFRLGILESLYNDLLKLKE